MKRINKSQIISIKVQCTKKITLENRLSDEPVYYKEYIQKSFFGLFKKKCRYNCVEIINSLGDRYVINSQKFLDSEWGKEYYLKDSFMHSYPYISIHLANEVVIKRFKSDEALNKYLERNFSYPNYIEV